MDVTVYPSRLSGTIQAPPSKSAAHRALICAALASLESGEPCGVWPILPSGDMEATRSGLEALGCEVKSRGCEGKSRSAEEKLPACEAAMQVREPVTQREEVMQSWLIRRAGQPKGEIRCGESGSTFRFFLPILAALGRQVRFTGKGRLPQRPMEPLFSILEQHGVSLCHPREASLPLSVFGCLKSGEFPISGNLSSQYVTGLLFALPLLCGDSRIRLTAPLESASYVEMTLKQLEQARIAVEKTKEGFFIPGGQRYRGREFFVEGDYSNSAFFLCGAAVAAGQGQSVSVEGLSPCSCQGDRRIAEILSRMGARVSGSGIAAEPNGRKAAERNICWSVKRGRLTGMEIDLKDIPDLGPALAAAGAYAIGKTTLFNGARLRFKESDRLSFMSDGLRRMGAQVTEFPDGLMILGRERLAGGCQVSSANDHRIAMALSIAALGCEKPVVIRQAECVNKSYPHFFQELNRLGGKTDVVNLG